MLKTRTVFVVGAGASVDFGFPLGGKLKESIATLTNIELEWGNATRGDQVIADAMRIHANNTESVLQRLLSAGNQIVRAMPGAVSIDNFLHSREGNADINLIGKLGIARAILKSERESPLYVQSQRELNRSKANPYYFNLDDSPQFVSQPDSWLGKFAPLLCQGFHANQLDDLFENVSFIIFNYDRCVEHYLWHHLQQYFGIDEADASALLAKAHFHHPYGSVGALPWQSGTGFTARFGLDPSPADLLEVAAGIKTFTESVHNEVRDNLADDLFKSNRVMFLGFGFIEQNMQLLALQTEGSIKNVYATALFMSDDSCAAIEDAVHDAFCLPRIVSIHTPKLVSVHANLTAAA